MTIQLTAGEADRRFISMRTALEERRKRELADPHVFDTENPIYTVLWSTLLWIVQDGTLLAGYFDAISRGRGREHVTCFEKSAHKSHIVSHSERCMDLYHALTAEDPIAIEDGALRRLIAMARVQDAAQHRRDVAEIVARPGVVLEDPA